MSGLVERTKSIFKRRPSQRDANPDGVTPVVGPNGLIISQPKQRPKSQSSQNQDTEQQHPPHQHHHPPEHHHPNRPHHHHEHRPQHHHHHPHGGDGTNEPAATVTGQLRITLQNDTGSSPVYAYVTGQAIDNNNALFLLGQDGRSPYYPGNVGSTNTRVAHDISIDLGPPGNSKHCVIPRLAGARIWFSMGKRLEFAINPGPGLVEPSIFNESDPNHYTNFGFMEFTFNSAQVFANISYVDFVGLPIALTLDDTSGDRQHVSGLPANGLSVIANGLTAQSARDGARWSSLIIHNRDGRLLRILSPNSGILLNPTLFSNYWTPYVHQVYGKYSTQTLTIDTQAGYGDVGGRVSNGKINFGPGGAFGRPSAADIFSCSTGPFATGGNAETNVIIPRLAAAFNRSTLLLTDNQPDGAHPSQYYQNTVTNHYSRIVHAANLDGHGYAFPYDDVTPDGGVPQEGAVFSYSPIELIVTVGGRNAHA